MTQEGKRTVFALKLTLGGKAYEIAMATPPQARLDAALLPKPKPRTMAFGTALCIQLVVALALVLLSALIPERLASVGHYLVTSIETPHVSAWKPQPVIKPVKMKPPLVAKAPVVAEVPAPRIYTPVSSSPAVKPATAKKNAPVPDLPEVSKNPSPTAPLASLAPTMPNVKKPRAEVQTGGFGDPDGLPSNNRPGVHATNVERLGGYDMPLGPGFGNGRGGSTGSKGIVANAGFGDGTLGGATGVTIAKSKSPTATAPEKTPVQILSKPKPAYSELARSKKIEGEVLVEVVFTASGEVKVERVVKGLGYGLDESAQSAARGIRFKPATVSGQPVDSNAIVHIVFELAY